MFNTHQLFSATNGVIINIETYTADIQSLLSFLHVIEHSFTGI